jgi:3-hydroxyisobutyrate dehydrogenase-like beta-hydroxyacid dehydrogenase
LQVGIVGLGEMGMPMLERLRSAGHAVDFQARRSEAIEAATSAGARLVDGFGDCDVVVVCVFSDEQVRDVASTVVPTMRPDAIFVNHTTGDPGTATWLDELAAGHGVRVLDAALSGSPASVRGGSLTLLVGGDVDVLDAARPALSAYADPILHVGALGDGQRVKLINNALLIAQIALAAEAERVAGATGVDASAALDAIARCSGDSSALRLVASMGSAAALEAAAGRFLRKDAEMVIDVAASAGIDLGRLDPSRWRSDLGTTP